MKLREDFVSNSSSSSYVVRADGQTPEIFREQLIDFSKYAETFLSRDVIGGIETRCEWRKTPIEKIRSDTVFYGSKDFVREYVESDCRSFETRCVALKRDRELFDEAMAATLDVRAYDDPIIEVYTRGARNAELNDAVRRAVFDEQQRRAGDRLAGIFDKMVLHFRQLLSSKMGTWKFWYAEIDDCDECDADRALEHCKWRRVFNNH